MSTLSTRAPSLAKSAPNGLPTTSDRLITVITFLFLPSAPHVTHKQPKDSPSRTITIRQQFVIHAYEFKHLDDRQWGAGQDGFDGSGRGQVVFCEGGGEVGFRDGGEGFGGDVADAVGVRASERASAEWVRLV